MESQIDKAGWSALIVVALLTVLADVKFSAATSASQLIDGKAADFVAGLLVTRPRLLTTLFEQGLVIAALHLLFFAWIGALGRCRKPQPRWYEASAAGILCAFLATSWVLLRLNGRLFPYSVWNWQFVPLFEAPAAVIADVAAPAWLLWRLASLLRALPARLPRSRRGRLLGGTVVSLLVAGSALAAFDYPMSATRAAGPLQTRPNIVVIGLDSLQRDIALGRKAPPLPGLAAFRAGAFVQANGVSPLPRTFPAWVTLLTGEHPQESGARFNLARQTRVDRDKSLAFTLRRQGYRTVYATDETRFSNIGHGFGFDEVYSPTPGVTDYLLAQIGDQPLVNLAVALPYAEVLLPALVGNRAFAQAYEPLQFVARLAHGLGPATGQPSFLAIHLCLAHWPYHAAKDEARRAGELPYHAAARELDQQFSELLARLQRLGYTNAHSIVVVLADHGEGVDKGESVPRKVVSHRPGYLAAPPPGGHGGTLLDPMQWQVFLMFSGQGANQAIEPGDSEQLFSLEDLAPSLLRLAGFDSDSPYVLDVVQRENPRRFPKAEARPYVVLETGFRPPHFDPTNPDPGRALRIAESSYNVLANGRVEMRDEVFDAAILEKDFGVTDGVHSLVAALGDSGRVLISTEISSRRWEIFDAEPPADPARIPLLRAGCAVPAMRAVIPAYCAPGAVQPAAETNHAH